jgi:hypothetical protein
MQLKKIASLIHVKEGDHKNCGNRPNREIISQDHFLHDLIRSNRLKIKEDRGPIGH